MQEKTVSCKVRGRLKKDDVRIVVGDRVLISAVEGTPSDQRRLEMPAKSSDFGLGHLPKRGMIERVLPRKNLLIRPPVANVDLVVLVFTIREPVFNWNLVDRLLVLAESAGLEPVLCLNKIDLLKANEDSEVVETYKKAQYSTYCTSALTGEGINRLADRLAGHTSVLAGQSGVGKSRLINALVPGSDRKVGSVGSKGQRGRHTTRSVELKRLPAGGFVADTPGFSRLTLTEIRKEDLGRFFPEMSVQAEHCKFKGCLHFQEPECAVKSAVFRGEIPNTRYENYLGFLKELEEWETRRYN